MPQHTLNKLLDKRQTIALLEEFRRRASDVTACWIVGQDGSFCFGCPDKPTQDFSSLIAQLCHTRDTVTTAHYIASPIFLHTEVGGGVIVRLHGAAHRENLLTTLQVLSAALTQLANMGVEKKAILQDTLDKYREIMLLYTIGQTIATCLDVEQITQLMLQTTAKIIKAENSSVMLLNLETQALELKAIDGLEHTQPGHLQAARGMAALVVRTGHPEIVNDLHVDDRLTRHTDEVRSLLCVPLKVQERILGAMSVSNKLSREIFLAQDEKLLMTLAAQAAVAIENALLVAELRDKNATLEQALHKVDLLETIQSHLSKFVPQSVRRLIDANPNAPALAQREQEISVLFIDIAGYTKMSEALSEAKVNDLIERYFSSFLDDILKNHGDISETSGDGLMIIFSEPDPDRHTLQVLRTALGIRDKTHQINLEFQREYEPVVVNMGINCGVALIGAVKLEGMRGTRWTYTANGPVINLAARLGAFATEGEVLVTEKIARRVWDQFTLEDMGPQHFKNIGEPVRVYRVLAEKSVDAYRSSL